MSSWRAGKIKLVCSIEILEKILSKIIPQWKDRIQVSAEGTIPFKHGRFDEKCHMVVPAVPGANRSPVGFKREADGQWTTYQIDYRLPLGEVQKEFASMTIKAEASKRKAVLVDEDDELQIKRLVFHVPVEERLKYQS